MEVIIVGNTMELQKINRVATVNIDGSTIPVLAEPLAEPEEIMVTKQMLF